MMTDLVHQDVPDDRAQRFVVVGPVIEDRPAIEPDHIRHLHRRAFAAERQADALEQAEQIELALGVHLLEHFVGRKIIDLNNQIDAQIAKPARQMPKDFTGENFDLGERRRLQLPTGQRIG